MAAKVNKALLKSVGAGRQTPKDRQLAIEHRKAAEALKELAREQKIIDIQNSPYYNNPIVAAAIWSPSNEAAGVVTGSSHAKCMDRLWITINRTQLQGEYSRGQTIEGFITLDGTLLNRGKAAEAAKINGQIKDLWKNTIVLDSHMVNYYQKA